jgi:hypothetical protein
MLVRDMLPLIAAARRIQKSAPGISIKVGPERLNAVRMPMVRDMWAS